MYFIFLYWLNVSISHRQNLGLGTAGLKHGEQITDNIGSNIGFLGHLNKEYSMKPQSFFQPN